MDRRVKPGDDALGCHARTSPPRTDEWHATALQKYFSESLSPSHRTWIIVLDVRFDTGRCHEASWWRNRMRRPRAWFAATAPGRPRDPARAALGPLCEELAAFGRRQCRFKKRGTGDENRRDGAPGGARVLHRIRGAARHLLRDKAPSGAPSPRLFGGQKKGHRRPRAANNRGGHACLASGLTGRAHALRGSSWPIASPCPLYSVTVTGCHGDRIKLAARAQNDTQKTTQHMTGGSLA
jgi:hypothetical protein